MQHDAEWARAKKLCRLSAEDVRMAKELGFKPKSLIKNIPNRSQPWKAPVAAWVRHLYEKKTGKRAQAAPFKPPSPKPEPELDFESYFESVFEPDFDPDFESEPPETVWLSELEDPFDDRIPPARQETGE
ncbi:MAG: hypothetical protein HY822_13900 [Acidobacteria bacterium]|nr:hypothetical protein [Acidobacteriota bacterium]